MGKWWTSAFASRFQPPPFRALRNFFGQERHRPPSPKVPVRLCRPLLKALRKDKLTFQFVCAEKLRTNLFRNVCYGCYTFMCVCHRMICLRLRFRFSVRRFWNKRFRFNFLFWFERQFRACVNRIYYRREIKKEQHKELFRSSKQIEQQ